MVARPGELIVVDDASRMRLDVGEVVETRTMRFRTLGCWPVTATIESDATDLVAILKETLAATASERQGRISDGEGGGLLEGKKRGGYFQNRSAPSLGSGLSESSGESSETKDTSNDP